MYSSSDVTLCVPAHKDTAMLHKVFDGIEALDNPPFRVLLIDDGSSPSLNIDGVECLRHDVNRGLAASRNTALSVCSTRLIAFLDSDVVPEHAWLDNLIEELHLSKCSAAGGKLLEVHVDGLGNQWRVRHMQQHWGDSVDTAPRFLYGSNCVFEADALRSVCGFDERYHTHDEDRAMSRSLQDKGYRLVYTPEATCHHLKSSSWADVLHDYWHWHYSKGLLNGDYDSPEGVIGRIEIVNFGISRYRLHLDQCSEGKSFRFLDAVIPFVFCSRDLDMLSKRTGLSIPAFPHDQDWVDRLPQAARQVFMTICPMERGGKTAVWHGDYKTEFDRCLVQSNWMIESSVFEMDHQLYATLDAEE